MPLMPTQAHASLTVVIKRGFLSANLAVGMRDPKTKLYIKTLIEKNGW
jgi:hypothetical protein